MLLLAIIRAALIQFLPLISLRILESSHVTILSDDRVE